ncbi:hypothetical protein [Deinococcus ficus]|uniref:hypothetical protein n=1 Tax=Deinococcus ficus TaxID=317577 RepID=UPI0017488902|nr:hypothetical protein [Deinococcus ficus]
MLHNRRTGRYIINADSFSSYEVFPMIDRYIVRDTLGGFRVLPAGLSALAQHEAQA